MATKNFYVHNGLSVGSSTIDAATGNTLITGITTLTNTTSATSTITGALRVAGGVGIGGSLYVGGEIVADKLTIQLTTVTTTLVETDDIIRTLNTTNATSSVTGALQVAGGVGIVKDLWVGGSIYGEIAGSISSATNATNAANVATIARTTSATHFLTFVDSNNITSANELVYTTSSFVVNPSTGFVGIGTASPAHRLQVSSGAVFATGDASAVSFYMNANQSIRSSGTMFIDADTGGQGGFTRAGTGDIIFRTANAQERVRIISGGNVGLGTSSPTSLLHVNGTTLLTGITTITNTTVASSTITGALVVAGGIGVGNNVYISGSLFATTKSFLIDHPTKEGKKLRYGSLEGPENGIYIRGRTQDTVIELPEYWTKLVDPESITVNLTPIGKSRMPSVNKIENNRVYLDKPWFGKIDCYYIIFAERADIEKLETEM